MTTFADLVHIYRAAEISSESETVIYCPNTSDQLALLEGLNENSDKTGILVIGENLKVGDSICLQVGAPKPAFGRTFKDLPLFLSGDMKQLFSTFGGSPYYIFELDVASTDEALPLILQRYHSFRALLVYLGQMAAYTDSINKKLIFFSKNVFELSIDIDGKVSKFNRLLSDFTPERMAVITDFIKWLDADSDSSHLDEKKSILAYVLSDAFAHQASFLQVLDQVENVYQSIQAQYALYLENFSYKKFVENINETNDKFIARVNETIGKLLPQFLGLPFLTAIPSALKSADNWLVYIALLFYCAMCYCGLSTQKTVLNYLAEDVAKHINESKLPPALLDRWNNEKRRIEKLIAKQNFLYYLLCVALITCVCYGVYKLIPFLVNFLIFFFRMLFI